MIKLLKRFKKKEWLFSFIALILIVVEVWLELKMPDYMSQITKLVQTEGSKMSEIIYNGTWMIICAFGSLVAAIIVGYIIANVASSFSMNLRKSLFSKVEELSMSEIKLFKTNSLITRTTNDITQIEMLISFGLQLLLKAPITATWAILKILNKSWQWSVATAVAVVILLSVIGIITMIVMPKFKIVQKLIDKVNGVTRENLTGIKVVRAFNAEKYQEEKFEEINEKLTNQQLFNQKKFAILSPIMFLVMNGLALSIYFIGSSLIDRALMVNKIALFGDMVVFSSYAMQIIMSFLMLAMIFMMLPRAQVSAERINEVLETKNSVIEGNFSEKTKETGTVEFKNVSFKYPDAEDNVISNINFVAKPGQTTAFIGSTGSGKSTLINLIPRFFDVTEGEILVNGVDIRNINQHKLRDEIGYVPQKAVLFSGTIDSNIRYGAEDSTKEDIREAASIAQAMEFIESKPDKFETEISQGGTNVSGGQKQRLSIARALAKKPKIFIFDDSFSALDLKTDAKLRKELKSKTKDATVLIVAQRISTILHADQIVVLDEGKVVGIGTHDELMKNCEVYKQIALSQLSKEELDNE